MLSFEDAKARLLALARPVQETEELDLGQALGRVLAQDLSTPMDVPPFTNSAMDGYALRTADVVQPGTVLPVTMRIAAGQCADAPLPPGSAARIFTGAPLPDGADTVVMQEDCELHQDGQVEIKQLPRQGQHVRPRGGELRTGDGILPKGTWLSAPKLGVAAAVGISKVAVTRPLEVALFFTGNELRTPGQTLAPGQIYNVNQYVMRGVLTQLGVRIRDLGIVADDREATRAALRQAATADLVLTSGGMSVGEEDYVTAIMKEEGELDVWKIAVKPGKPLAFGRIGQARFIGLPGNPVAAWVGLMTLVLPFLRRCQGAELIEPPPITLRADFSYQVKGDRPEFIRVKRNAAGGLDVFRTQDSSAISSAAWADGLVLVPAGSRIQPGDPLPYQPLPI